MESEFLKIAILAVVQGITEFLPISSSGHLVIFQQLLGIKEDNLFIAVLLHAGTLMSIIAYYFRDLIELAKPKNLKIVLMLFIGTLPLVFGGLIVKPLLEEYFESLWVVGIGLMMTASFLIFVHKSDSPIGKDLGDMNWKEAILIGLFQCMAITPGISRSGSTISIATRLGFMHKTAAKFSFFLGIPGIFGACLLIGRDIMKASAQGLETMTISVPAALFGFFLSFIVGYFAIKILIHTLTNNTFSYFGYYCLVISISAFALILF